MECPPRRVADQLVFDGNRGYALTLILKGSRAARLGRGGKIDFRPKSGAAPR